MKQDSLDTELNDYYEIKKNVNNYIIDENIYNSDDNANEDDRLSYFREDVDLNTYNYNFHVDQPFWMDDEILYKLKTRPWELNLHLSQQILAKNYFERLSVGMGPISDLSFVKPIQNAYSPRLTLHNGITLPSRPNNYVVLRDTNIETLNLIKSYETIITEGITKGYVEIDGQRLGLKEPEDIELLGKLIYSTVDKVGATKGDTNRYLPILLESAVGLNQQNSDKYSAVLSVLDNYQTALRDPIFFQIQKRLCDLSLLFKNRLTSYTRDELYFPGVKIDSIVVDKLITYFDDYLMDITNAATFIKNELSKTTPDMFFFTNKRRLNNQPFTVTVDVVSDKAVDCVVRMFLGPKLDHLGRLIDLNTNRLNFVELDSFRYKLTTGKNTITRKSVDMHNLVRDRIMTQDLWKKFNTTDNINDFLKITLKNYNTGFPIRLLLRKGQTSGMKCMLYVIVTPLKLVDNVDLSILDTTRKDLNVDFRSTVLLDKMPLGFPFDRVIDVTKFWTPSMKLIDVTIFHDSRVNDTRSLWDQYVLREYNLINDTSTETDRTYSSGININTNLGQYFNI